MSDSNSNEVERIKYMIDFVKHITTLSTGSILLLATFLEKLFTQPQDKILVPISFAGFIISVVFAIVAQGFLIQQFTEKQGTKRQVSLRRDSLIFTVIMWLSFLIGIGSLSMFAMSNFLA